MAEHLTLAVHAAGPVRSEELMGRTFKVFPAVLVREQVLNNNLGRTFLPAEEIEASVDAWNGIPVVIRHPLSRGMPVSARSPEVLNARGAGFLFRARYEDAALKADVFLDMERAAVIPDTGDVVNRVEAGEVGELSTGFATAMEMTAGTWEGEPFDLILRAIRPDHLALLPTEVGACSVADGCGLGVNAATEDPVVVSDTAASDAPGNGAGDTVPAENNAGDLPQEVGDMDREQMIATLAAAGPLDQDSLNKLTDCQLKALANVGKATNSEPEGDGWDKAREWREKFENLRAQTANAVAREENERTNLLDDLLFNVRGLPYTEEEIKAKDIVELRKIHKLAFPTRADYSLRGGPRAANQGGDFSFVRGIMDGPDSVLDRKEN